MRAARLRGAAHAGVVILTLAFSAYGAAAEPLQLAIASASAGLVRNSGEALVDIRLTDDSQRRFADFTKANVGHMIDLRIDGKSVNKPVVREPITGGGVQLLIGKPGEAEPLAARLSNQTATLEVEAVSH
jgi:preprotein translocase subunit SecD